MSDTKKDKKSEQVNQDLVPNGTDVTPATDPTEEAAKKIIAEAEAKAAKIVADAEAKAEAKQNETPPEKANPADELVEYEAPLLADVKSRSIFVSVNGENMLIKRGVPVTIKRKFVEALQNAAKQEFAAFESRQQLQKQSEKPLAAM